MNSNQTDEQFSAHLVVESDVEGENSNGDDDTDPIWKPRHKGIDLEDDESIIVLIDSDDDDGYYANIVLAPAHERLITTDCRLPSSKIWIHFHHSQARRRSQQMWQQNG